MVHETEEQTKEFRSIVYNYSSGNKVSYYDAVIYHEIKKKKKILFNISKSSLMYTFNDSGLKNLFTLLFFNFFVDGEYPTISSHLT
jgi:hypothetical protein